MRPARAALALSVASARAANRKRPAGRRAAILAADIPERVRATLYEEAVRDRLELAIALEKSRRILIRLKGLERALKVAGDAPPVIVCPPVLGDAARFLTCSPGEVDGAASIWRAYGEALARNPRAERGAYPFPDPPKGSSLDRASGRAQGDEAADVRQASAAVSKRRRGR